MARNKNSRGGFILPLVVFFSILVLMGLLIAVQHMQFSSKTLLNEKSQLNTDGNTKAAVQVGIISLNKRLSYLSDRIESGLPDASAAGGIRYISDTDIGRYATQSPGALWIEWLNHITDTNGAAVSDQPDFSLSDPSTAFYEVDSSSYHVTIKLISGFALGPLQAENTSGYNNVTLRYGYEITGREKLSGQNRTEKIISAMQTQHIGSLIQIHLSRELSRYNLFAINNTMPDGTPMYDRTSYQGRVYSKYTFYVGGRDASMPQYSDTVEISNLANPAYRHKDGGAFQFTHPDGSADDPLIITPYDMPSNQDMNTIRDLCTKQNVGQNPNALTTPGTYVGNTTINGVSVVTSIFSNPGPGRYTKLNASVGGPRITNWTVSIPGLTGTRRTIAQDSSVTPAFLIFSWGPLTSSQMQTAVGTQATINALNDITLSNVSYENGIDSVTVTGFVSWQGNVLVSNTATGNPTIQAVIMAVNGGFGSAGYSNFSSNYTGYRGTIYFTGSIIRQWSLPTLSQDLTLGWGLVSAYDPYLKDSKAPPYFPGTGHYKVIEKDLVQVIDQYNIERNNN